MKAQTNQIDPGPGYRLLELDERLEQGDEYYFHLLGWRPTNCVGMKSRSAAGGFHGHRRKISEEVHAPKWYPGKGETPFVPPIDVTVCWAETPKPPPPTVAELVPMIKELRESIRWGIQIEAERRMERLYNRLKQSELV